MAGGLAFDFPASASDTSNLASNMHETDQYEAHTDTYENTDRSCREEGVV